LRPQLDAIRVFQGRLLGQSDLVVDEAHQQAQLDALVQSALRTSEIEGETLNVGSVRSSVVRKLGLERAGFVEGLKDAPATPQTEALVGLLLEATADADLFLGFFTRSAFTQSSYSGHTSPPSFLSRFGEGCG